jgi:hypothetical protein
MSALSTLSSITKDLFADFSLVHRIHSEFIGRRGDGDPHAGTG